MSYSVYLRFENNYGELKSIRVSVSDRDKNRIFSQIGKLPEKELSQVVGKSIEISAESFRISRKILKSLNKWLLCFPNFKNKQGLFLMVVGPFPSSAELFADNLLGAELKRDYDITVKYIECQKT